MQYQTNNIYRYACLLAGWLIFLSIPQAANAQAFTIRQYDISVKLNPNGSARVTETIEVFFNEERRGIFRNIPYKYTTQAIPGEKARRTQGGQYYETIIKDVRVDGHPFQLFEEEAYLVIRIGDPNVYLSGKQTYRISYTIWGALNDFEDNIEFYWNLIGTEWDTRIDNATFQIEFPRNQSISQDDVVVFTGRSGSKETDAEWQLSRGQVSGKTTRRLNAREGLTLAVRFPPDFFDNVEIPIREFAERYFVDYHKAEVTVNTDASLDVVESFRVNFILPTSDFTRSLGINPLVFGGEKQFVFVDKEVLYVSTQPDIPVNIRINRRRNLDLIRIHSANQPFTGVVTFRFQYKVWGAMGNQGEHTYLKWELMNIDADEPIRQSSFSMKFPEGYAPDQDAVDFEMEGTNASPQVTFNYEGGENTLRGNAQRNFLHGEGYTISFPLTGKRFDLDKLPLQVFAQYYILDNMRTDVYVENGGVVRIRQELMPEFIYPENQTSFEPYFRTTFYRDDTLSMPNSNWLAADHQPIITDIEITNEDKYEIQDWNHRKRVQLANEGQDNWDSPFVWEFTQYGIMERSGGKWRLNYPLLFPMDDPVRQGSFRVHFAESINPDEVQASITSTDGRIDIPADIREDGIRGLFLEHLRPGEALVLNMETPTEFVGGSRFDLWSRMYLRNNIFIFLAVLIGGILTLIWHYFGRDPQDAVVVHYYPPKDITPAEAGLLWDDKLHKKDLISLIYYWASQGLLKIREEGEKKKDRDYTLIKQKELPVEAKPFEKVMFNGLFKNGEEQKVSGLRDTYYATMKSAHKSLESYGKQHHFYQPGTRGFGCLLKIVGAALLLFGVFTIGLGYFYDNYSIGIPATALAIVTLLIARVMPKKGPFGHKKYTELLGFAEFVRHAEIDRIKALVDENPRYFDETISYAIVFGMGESWAEQFEDLMTEPPDWYEGRRRGDHFSTIWLVNSMTRSMNKMNTDFNYQAPAQSTSSWGGSGGSGFGGGGFSGGGFGGGGGGSW